MMMKRGALSGLPIFQASKAAACMRILCIQIKVIAVQSVKDCYCCNTVSTFRNQIRNPRCLLNIDETSIYIYCTPTYIVDP